MCPKALAPKNSVCQIIFLFQVFAGGSTSVVEARLGREYVDKDSRRSNQ